MCNLQLYCVRVFAAGRVDLCWCFVASSLPPHSSSHSLAVMTTSALRLPGWQAKLQELYAATPALEATPSPQHAQLHAAHSPRLHTLASGLSTRRRRRPGASRTTWSEPRRSSFLVRETLRG